MTQTQRKQIAKAAGIKAARTRRNNQFKKASMADKRVLIAKDILAQIKAKTMIPQQGTWSSIKVKEKTIPEDAQVCDILNRTDTICTCCALGAMMIAEIRINNALKFGDLSHGYMFNSSFSLNHQVDADSDFPYEEDRIRNYFSQKQIVLIETAFEVGNGQYARQTDMPETTNGKAIGFGRDRHDPQDRLVAIMENIISNKGTFKP